MTECLLCAKEFNVPLSLSFLMNFKAYHQPVICKICRDRFQRISKERCCRDCSRAGEFKNDICLDCLRWRRITGERFLNYSLYQYNSMMSEFMHCYKFQGDYRLRYVFKDQFSHFVVGMHRLIVPIPIHQKTRLHRGFNQVNGLLDGVKIIDALITKQNQKIIPQSHKNRTARLHLKQPFRIVKTATPLIAGHNLVIADDVYTTGTTIRYAAELLKKLVLNQ